MISLRFLPQQIRCCANFCTQQTTKKMKLFSGIQPSGMAHLGNYLGVIKYWVSLQNRNEDLTLSIVDLHAITLAENREKLEQNVLEMTAILLASNIDPQKVIIFQQSALPQHTELCWILCCLSSMSRLTHLPQFKEKVAEKKEVPLGLYLYPVLQAADILLHRSTHVPVGEDQIQHLHLTQHFAKILNERIGCADRIPVPQILHFNEATKRIKSFRDPSRKMSKSEPDSKSRIDLIDDESTIHEKVKKSVTDCIHEIYYDPVNRAGLSNLLRIGAVLAGETLEDFCRRCQSLNKVQFKTMLATLINHELEPIRKRYHDLIQDRSYLIETLRSGASRAYPIAEQTMTAIRTKIGFNLNAIDSKTNQQQVSS